MVLCARYAMSGTAVAYGATGALYDVPGTEACHMVLRAR